MWHRRCLRRRQLRQCPLRSRSPRRPRPARSRSTALPLQPPPPPRAPPPPAAAASPRRPRTRPAAAAPWPAPAPSAAETPAAGPPWAGGGARARPAVQGVACCVCCVCCVCCAVSVVFAPYRIIAQHWIALHRIASPSCCKHDRIHGCEIRLRDSQLPRAYLSERLRDSQLPRVLEPPVIVHQQHREGPAVAAGVEAAAAPVRWPPRRQPHALARIGARAPEI
jgi:hypothetical protein